MTGLSLRRAAATFLPLLLAVAGCDGPADPQSPESGTLSLEDFYAAEAVQQAHAGSALTIEARDRMGMPAVNTALITSKDLYNVSSQLDDIAGVFVAEITANIAALHAALDDDLIGLGLTPCVTGDCVNQGAPLIIPDAIVFDTNQPSGFPNGRRLEDPVIDLTLALILLDLGVHDITTLLGVNPTENDKPFRSTFPYLAPSHRRRMSAPFPHR